MDKSTRLRDLTDDDVLRVDPVNEYQRRFELRKASASRLAQVRDESDPYVELGRPTGP